MSVAIDHGPVRRVRTGDRLQPNDIGRIVADLKDWSKPKITWNMVVSAVEGLLKPRRFSRQALQAHPEIYRAYAKAKRRLRNGLPLEKRKPLAERIAAREAENRRLRAENDVLLEMFVKWLLNAKKNRVRLEQLDEPLLPARLPSDVRDTEVVRKEAERAAQLEKLKQRVLRKAVERGAQ
jgi:hypothetical protein